MASADILMTPEQLSYAHFYHPLSIKQESMSSANPQNSDATMQDEFDYWSASLPVGSYPGMMSTGEFAASVASSGARGEIATSKLDELPQTRDEPGLGITTIAQDMCHSPNETALPYHFTPEQHTNTTAQYGSMLSPNWGCNHTPYVNPSMPYPVRAGIRLQTTFEPLAETMFYEPTNTVASNEAIFSTYLHQLQEPFNFQPNMARQTCHSSYPPGLTPSTATTPVSCSTSNYTPASATSYWSSASPNTLHPHSSHVTPMASPLPRPIPRSPARQSEHIQTRDIKNQTYPRAKSRRPHVRPSLSESSIMRTLSPRRGRTLSAATPLQMSQSSDSFHAIGLADQLPLPACPPSVLMKLPAQSRSANALEQSPNMDSDTSATFSKSTGTGHDVVSSPPASDMNPIGAPYLVPIRQEPRFEGDVYTAPFKRRTGENKWEGWCGYCKPGRWLNLKNSRYWEDKYRNHGICARTRTYFEGPEAIRFVNADTGEVYDKLNEDINNGKGKTVAMGIGKFVDSRVNRTREGLCGKCKAWVRMEGKRTKARDRAVGWWEHAYKCHEQGRRADDEDEQEERLTQTTDA